MSEQVELVKRLSFENLIWIVYIGVAVFNIYGDELIKRAIQDNDKFASKRAKKIFLVVLTITIIIYFYFLVRNYNDWKNNQNNQDYKVRLFGSILTFVGILCFLYFQLSITNDNDSSSII